MDSVYELNMKWKKLDLLYSRVKKEYIKSCIQCSECGDMVPNIIFDLYCEHDKCYNCCKLVHVDDNELDIDLDISLTEAKIEFHKLTIELFGIAEKKDETSK